MKKQALFMVALLAAVGLLAGFTASSAFAYAGGFAQPCVQSGCHGNGGAAAVVTLVSNDGSHATYNVAVTGGHEWAVFSGTTRVTAHIPHPHAASP